MNDDAGPLRDRLAMLTDRQREVGRLLAAGRSPRDIASTFDMPLMTFWTHCHQMRQKLCVRSTAELVKTLRALDSAREGNDEA